MLSNVLVDLLNEFGEPVPIICDHLELPVPVDAVGLPPLLAGLLLPPDA